MMETAFKKAIATAEDKYLLPINQNDYPFRIMAAADDFKRTLYDNNILSEEDDEGPVKHTSIIPLTLDDYYEVKEVACWLCADFFDAVYCYVVDKNDNSGVIFVGFEKEIAAATTLFTHLSKIMLATRKQYISTLKRFKKQSSKEERADEHMDEWIESFLGRNRYDEYYEIAYAEEFLAHTKKHFYTAQEQNKLLLQAMEILNPVIDDKKDPATTIAELKEIFSDKHQQHVKTGLKKSQSQKMIVSFPYQEWIEEHELLEET